MQLPPLLLIDKPTGMTSFDVIRVLRRKTGVRKFGHAGTLDPAASGLMLIGVEAGTKQLASLIKLDKEYLADILIGESRTTGDMDGTVLESTPLVTVSEAAIATILRRLVGTVTLPVSAYSAIKRNGVPMYERAREAAKLGELIHDVPFRDMKVYEAELLGVRTELVGEYERPIATVRFAVGSGTYIRSLAEEVGRQLGYPAVLYGLRRTKVGEYRVEDARSLERF